MLLPSFTLVLVGSADQSPTTALQGESRSFWVCSRPSSTLCPASLWGQEAPECSPVLPHPGPSQQAGYIPGSSPHQELGSISSHTASSSCAAHPGPSALAPWWALAVLGCACSTAGTRGPWGFA